MWAVWIQNARTAVLFAAHKQGSMSALPRDEHRDEDAYSHARDRATAACTTDPGFFRTEAHCVGWMITAGRNAVKDEARRIRTRARRERACERPEPMPDHSGLWTEIEAALPEVSPEARAVLEPYLAGRSPMQIAERLGTTREKVYPRLEKARAELRDRLAARGITAADLCRPSERPATETDED